MAKEYLEIGEIVGTHGIAGEMRLYPWCDTPHFVQQFSRLFLDAQGQKALTVQSSRVHGNLVLLKIEGIHSFEQASLYRGKVLYMARREATLQEGEYFQQDLMGCRVLDADSGMEYGAIHAISKTGANDVWHIRKDGREWLLPAVKAMVREIDIAGGQVRICPIKGIFDDAD